MDIKVRLVGQNGNAFSILGRVSKCLQFAGVSQGEVDKYIEEATSGDYDNSLNVTSHWVSVAVRSYYADISYHRQLEEFTTQCINSGGTPIMNSDMKACIKK